MVKDLVKTSMGIVVYIGRDIIGIDTPTAIRTTISLSIGYLLITGLLLNQ